MPRSFSMLFDEMRDIYTAKFSIAEDGLDDENVCLELVHRVHCLAATPPRLQQRTEEGKDFGCFEVRAKMRKRKLAVPSEEGATLHLRRWWRAIAPACGRRTRFKPKLPQCSTGVLCLPGYYRNLERPEWGSGIALPGGRREGPVSPEAVVPGPLVDGLAPPLWTSRSATNLERELL